MWIKRGRRSDDELAGYNYGYHATIVIAFAAGYSLASGETKILQLFSI